MVSHRKRKKEAERLGVTATELDLVALLEEVLDQVRWLKVLGYANQHLLGEHLKIPAAERDRILAAAARAVEDDRQEHAWRARIAALKEAFLRQRRELRLALREGPAAAEAAHGGE
ncbi:MAG: hypothetical protein IT458_06805 [Planctomycetes bacterium]|nr:hypothetical protein [Planctomycetota bacterium]